MTRTRTPINPLTALVAGWSSWILVLGVNVWQFSLAVTLVAGAVGMWRTRNLSVVAATALLTLPTALSMLLVHAPYGEARLAPLLTLDGLAVAAGLSLRFSALMASLLAAAAFIRVPDLAKALQVSPLGPRVAYVVASALQLLPQGRHTVEVVRDANQLAGRPVGAGNVLPRMVLPVMTQLISANAAKSRALETAGLDLPGRRTILRPVPDSRAQQVARVLMPLLAVAGVML